MLKLSAAGDTARADSPSAGALVPGSQLGDLLAAVEGRLAALGEALRTRDSAGIELHAGELQRALVNAVDPFARAARSGELSPAWRHRLALAGAQVAAQRESLARATASLDRAIELLLPVEGSALYSTHGNPQRATRSGAAQA